MAEYALPKRGVAFITYMGLVSQADTKLLIASPTLAAGDFKISKDGGATADLATLPTNTPAASSQIKISISATEMEADNVTLVGIDAAGAQWCSFCLNIQTATRAAEDMAFPTVSGRSLDVSAAGEAGIDWANIGSPTTAVNLSATNIDVDQIVASVSGAVGSVTGLTAANLDATISSRATPAEVNLEVLDVLNVDTFAQPGQGAPAATQTIRGMIALMYKGWRNRNTQTATQYSLYNDDAATIDQKATFSDDGTTADRQELASGP